MSPLLQKQGWKCERWLSWVPSSTQVRKWAAGNRADILEVGFPGIQRWCHHRRLAIGCTWSGSEQKVESLGSAAGETDISFGYHPGRPGLGPIPSNCSPFPAFVSHEPASSSSGSHGKFRCLHFLRENFLLDSLSLIITAYIPYSCIHSPSP